MKRIIVLLSLVLLGLQVYAQDIITKKDGTTLNVKVLTATSKGIKYMIPSEQPGGQVYFTPIEEYTKIQYKKSLRPNMKYRELRRMYNTRDYVHYENAAYQPGLMGIASFLVPGLGACLADEWGRGLTCFVGTGLLFGASYGMFAYNAPIQATVAMAGGLVLWAWSIVDAVKISKVKNMYIHEYMKMYGANFIIKPTVSYAALNNSMTPVAGLSISLNF